MHHSSYQGPRPTSQTYMADPHHGGGLLWGAVGDCSGGLQQGPAAGGRSRGLQQGAAAGGCVHVCAHAPVCACMCACTCRHVCVCVFRHVHVCVHMHICTSHLSLATLTDNSHRQLSQTTRNVAFFSSFFPWQGQSEWGKGAKWVRRLGGAPPVRCGQPRLASPRLTVRDGRRLTARGS